MKESSEFFRGHHLLGKEVILLGRDGLGVDRLVGGARREKKEKEVRGKERGKDGREEFWRDHRLPRKECICLVS